MSTTRHIAIYNAEFQYKDSVCYALCGKKVEKGEPCTEWNWASEYITKVTCPDCNYKWPFVKLTRTDL